MTTLSQAIRELNNIWHNIYFGDGDLVQILDQDKKVVTQALMDDVNDDAEVVAMIMSFVRETNEVNIVSSYTAYRADGTTVKAGTVKHVVDIEDDPRGPINFLDAVVADVGEERYENEVFGVRD